MKLFRKLLYFFSLCLCFSFLLPQNVLAATTPSCSGQPFSCYQTKYNFNTAAGSTSVPADVLQRLTTFAPHAAKGVAAYDKRFGQTIEPELVMWWTYGEGITAHENWSNCANEASNYATNLSDCDKPSFWQLGPAGIQFGFLGYFLGAGDSADQNTPMIKLAFQDTHGDPNNAQLVQQVGQAVLDYDKTQNVTPQCGGPSCTFPAMTIDQLDAGIYNGNPPFANSANKNTNWWTSVLARDPDISAYIQARGLWGLDGTGILGKGCHAIGDSTYCQQAVWQRYSDAMATILNLKLDNSSISEGDFSASSPCVLIPIGTDHSNPTPPPGCDMGMNCGLQQATVQAITDSLKPDGIILTGDDLNLQNAQEMYKTWCLLKKSSKYTQLLDAKNKPIEVRFLNLAEAQGAHAYPCVGYSSAAGTPNYVGLYGADVGPACTDYRLDFLIAHELGHHIRFRNPDIYNQWYSGYYNPSFPTWNCQLDYGQGPWPEECFPDMIAEYVFYKKWLMFTDPPKIFPEMMTTYIKLYTFTKDTIFGGVEY